MIWEAKTRVVQSVSSLRCYTLLCSLRVLVLFTAVIGACQASPIILAFEQLSLGSTSLVTKNAVHVSTPLRL